MNPTLVDRRSRIRRTPNSAISGHRRHLHLGDGRTARRVLFSKTRNHVYFRVDAARDLVVVLAV
jgi:hypothetical protein